MTATGLPSLQGCRASCIPHGDVGVEAEDSDDRAEAEDGGDATPGGVPASLALPNRHRPWLAVSMPSVECYEQFHEMQEVRQEQGNGLQALHHEQGSRSEESEGDFNLIAIRCLGSDPGMTAGCKRGMHA